MLARLAVLSACLVLTACQTPAELKTSATVEHDRAHYARIDNVQRIATCLQRRFENGSSFVSARVTPLGDGGHEVVARSDQLTFAVFEVYPAMTEFWVDPSFMRQDQAATMLAACR